MIERITNASRMPPNLPREEQKILIRPRGGLCIARLEADIVMSAVITAANVPKTAAKADTICTNPTQNIIVISTPDEERARYYASVRSLYIGGRNDEMHAYCTAPHGTVKGVIRGIAVENTAEDVHENIVNQANPQALEAHRIGNTTSIVILFAETKAPNYIKYGSIIVKCALYRQHYNVCTTCGKIGHRADVCPTPETKICFACGAPNPAADHAAHCKPRCKLCNGAHATGAEGCTNKYKVPFVVTQRRWERRNAGSTFSSQDFPQLPPQQQQQQKEAHLSKRRRSRSRKRDKSRGRSASRGRSTDGKRSENVNYNRNQQRPGNVASWAQAINPQAANRNPLNHVAQAKDNTVQSLRNENDQLKRCIAEQRAQMQEMNAKLNQLVNAQQQQQQQQATPTPPPSPPQIQPRPPTPTENNTNSAMEGHANDPPAYYVDVAKYPHRPNTYTAAVIAADTGVLTASRSIRCKSPTQAEEFAIALALAIPYCSTVLSDSKPAIVNFAANNVHGTTARVCSTIARPETNVTVKWFPAHTGELDAGPNRKEEADTEAHALTSRGSPSTHSSEPQRSDAEDEEYSITTYGDVLQWYRTSTRLYSPPHRDLQRSEAATLRQLQVRAIWTPVWAKHVCPEVYTTHICQHCKKARATQRHLLWDCAPPPGNQEEALPTAISSKIISREPGNQRDVVQHVLSILARQRPKAAPRGFDASRLLLRDVRARQCLALIPLPLPPFMPDPQ
ncbi:hypothetical protein HPB50_022626 [Hyalomma asiaticum]|uniref:Uncharacterized protein n=1 Tax=Hyalomma asiaticum TaxID=266040 RepID=A0ACB7SNM4_HYAAI|nr:hypothetical protein HPB50_022626 [Hyalomma asiaticum]